MAAPAKTAPAAPFGGRLDQTWQVGLGWGILLTILTIAGVWYAFRGGSNAAMLLPILGWVGFVAWLEKGVTK